MNSVNKIAGHYPLFAKLIDYIVFMLYSITETLLSGDAMGYFQAATAITEILLPGYYRAQLCNYV